MYNNTLSSIVRQPQVRTVAALIALGLVVLFIATHGFLILGGAANNYTYTHTSYNGNQTPKSSSTTGPFGLLASGNYSVQMPTNNGGIDTLYVSVPRFLTTATIKRQVGENKIETIGRGVYPRLANSPSGLLGWDEKGDRQPVNQRVIDSSDTPVETSVFYPNFEEVVQVNKSWVGGFTRGEEGVITPTYYDFLTNENYIYPSFKASQYPAVRRESTGFSMYDTGSQTYHLYIPGKTDAISFKPKTDHAATFDKRPLYSIGKDRSAIVTGADVTSSDENKNAKSEGSDFELRTFTNTNGAQLANKKIHGNIREVTLSPNGTYVYIKTEQSVAIYNTKTLNVIYAAPYDVNDFLWIDNDRFAYATGEQGLFIGSAKTGHARTAAPYKTLQPTQLSFVDDDWLYFSAYSQSNNGAQNPDAYRVALNTEATNETANILRDFPHKGDGYYIDYINGRLVVQLTQYVDTTGTFEDEDAKKASTGYIQDYFKGTAPEIIYDYTVSDLRPEPNVAE